MPKLVSIQLLHGVKVLRHWNIISVDESWTLRHVFENLADGTDGRDEGDSWTLDTALRGLPLVCKVGLLRKGDFLSLTVDDALEFGKYFRFILQGGGEGSGMAQSAGRPAPIRDAFAIMRSVVVLKLTSSMGGFDYKKKPCALLHFLGPKPVVWPYRQLEASGY